MRRKLIISMLILTLVGFSFAQNQKLDKESFFREFYGTFILVDDFRTENDVTDLNSFILMVEEKYKIDIPVAQEALFRTKDDVIDYVNIYLREKQQEVKKEQQKIDPVLESKTWGVKVLFSYGLPEPASTFGNMAYSTVNTGFKGYAVGVEGIIHPHYWNRDKNDRFAWGLNYKYSSIPSWRANAVPGTDTSFVKPLIHSWAGLNFHYYLTDNSELSRTGVYLTGSFRYSQYKVKYLDGAAEVALNPYHTPGVGAGITGYFFPVKGFGFELKALTYLDYVFRISDDWDGVVFAGGNTLTALTSETILNLSMVIRF